MNCKISDNKWDILQAGGLLLADILRDYAKQGVDSIAYTIYLSPHYLSKEGLIPIFRFDLVKKKKDKIKKNLINI
jgi:hypothetical protein